MRRLALSLVLLPAFAQAQTPTAQIEAIVEGHILPRFEALSETAQDLSDAAAEDCDPTSANLRSAYGAAFDAWISASHLRFGPTEVNDRAFALAFWPDSRGATPRALTGLLADADSVAESPESYAQVSIAARGFYALEFLLYDNVLSQVDAADYHCQLVQVVSADITSMAQDILADWQSGFADEMRKPTPNGHYRDEEEVLQEMFKSLSAGLQFTAETRLGRPLGTFDRPRPSRAEAHRSARSARHVKLSLDALHDLAIRLSDGDADLTASFTDGFEQAQTYLVELNDPIFASVSDPQTRLKVEVVQQSIEAVRTIAREQLGPTLGVAAGFNALDGD